MKSNSNKNSIFSEGDKKYIKKSTFLSIIPGLGQLNNKQFFKGVLFLSIFALFVVEMLVFGIPALEGLITLGTDPATDHSLFFLIEGALQIIIIIIFLIFLLANIVDAHKVAKMRCINPENVNYSVKDILNHTLDNGFPYLLTIPAYLLMAFSIIFPVLVTIFIAFTNYNFRNVPPANLIEWVGLDTFRNLFVFSAYRDTFLAVFSWTLIWTFAATTLQLIIGVFTAIVINQKGLKFKKIFGVIMLLPWAIPAFITVLTFSNMFNPSVGAINTQVIPFLDSILPFVELTSVPWKITPFWTRIAIIMIQGWVGFPYIYVLTSGVIQSIPDDWYEASVMDGASAIQKFRFITLPHIFTVAAPIFVTQYTGNFNNFNTIYLFNEGGPGSIGSGAGSTDILISWIYKLTTGTSPQYNVSAAITLIISMVVIALSMFIFSKTKAFEMGD